VQYYRNIVTISVALFTIYWSITSQSPCQEFITNADNIYIYACFLQHGISKTDAARITKIAKEMFHDEAWKPIYFRVKMSKVKVTSHKNIAEVGLCTFVSAGYF